MSIEMPAGLEWLSYLAGAAWPKGDEDSMFALDDDYKTAAKSLNGLIEQLHTACNTATDNYSGDGADKMKSQFDKFFSGDQSIAKMVENLNQIGKSAHDMGAEIEHTKLQVIITLAILAAEIAYALTTWFGAAVIPALEAETEGVMAVIGRTLATRLSWLVNHAKTIANMPLWKLAAISGGVQGGLGLLTEFAVEFIQNEKGHIDGYDLKRIFVAGAVGAAGGAVGAPVGSVIGKGLGNWVTKQWGMTTTRATGVAFVAGVGGGLAGVGAGFVTGGLLTGEWEFDPAMLAGGAAGGMFGALHGSIGHARDAALAKSSTLHPTDLKISGGDHFDGSAGNSRPDQGGGGGRSIMPDRVDDNGNSGQRTRPSSSPGDGSENGSGRPSDRPGSERGDGESRGGSTGPREFHDSTAPAQPAPVRRGSIANISTFSNSSATPSRSSSISASASDGSSSHTSVSTGTHSAPPPQNREFGATSETVSRSSSPGSHEFRPGAEVTTQKSSVVPENLSRSPSVSEHSEGGFTAVASHTSDEVTPHTSNQVASHDSNEVVSRPPSEHEFTPSEREFTPSEADSRSVSESSMRGPASETSSLAGSEGPVRSAPDAPANIRHGGLEIPSRPSTPESRPSSPETRSSTPETRPSSPETRSSTPETRPSTPETRPSTPETRPSSPETRPSSPETEPVSRRSEPPFSSTAPENGSRTRITAAHDESGPADSRGKVQPTPEALGNGRHGGPETPSRPNTSEGGSQSRIAPAHNESTSTGQRTGREDQVSAQGPSSRASSEGPERGVGPTSGRSGDHGDTNVGNRGGEGPRSRPAAGEPDGIGGARTHSESRAHDAPEHGATTGPHRSEHAGSRDERPGSFHEQLKEDIAAADRENARMQADTETRFNEKRDRLEQTRSDREETRQALNRAVDEFEAKVRGGLDEGITAARDRVEHERTALERSRRHYATEAADEEPQPQRLEWLKQEINAGTERLRSELVAHEALLRAANGDHSAELKSVTAAREELLREAAGDRSEALAAAQTERDRLESRWGRKGFASDALGWLRPEVRGGRLAAARAQERVAELKAGLDEHLSSAGRDFRSEVSQRVRELEHALATREAEAKAQAGLDELKSRLDEQTAAHAEAFAEFKSGGLEVLDKRWEVSQAAGKADLAAFEGGAVDRKTAFAAAARKEKETQEKFLELANIYDEEIFQRVDEALPRVSDDEIKNMVNRGSTMEKFVGVREYVRRATGYGTEAKGGRDLRDTQLFGIMSRWSNLRTGEGKTLVTIVKAWVAAREHERVYVTTSGDNQVGDLIDEFGNFGNSKSLIGGLDVKVDRMVTEGDLPKPGDGTGHIVVATMYDMKQRVLHEESRMLGLLEEKGMSAEEIQALRDRFNVDRPNVDEMTEVFNEAADRHGLKDRFEPFPPGKHIADEMDTLGSEESVLTPSNPDKMSDDQVAVRKQVHDRVEAAAALSEDPLTAKHFGKPDGTRGFWQAHASAEVIDRLNRVPGPRVTEHDPLLAEYAHKAVAKWGPERNNDYIEGRGDTSANNKIKTMASSTTDKVMADRSKGTETRFAGVSAYLEMQAGVDVMAELPKEALHMSDAQLIGTRLLQDTQGHSGTAKIAEQKLYDQGVITGPVREIDPYYKSQVEFLKDREFDNTEDMLKDLAGLILEDAKLELVVRDGQVVDVKATGLNQLVGGFDNRDLRGDDIRVDEHNRPVIENGERVRLSGWQDKKDSEKGVVDWVDELVDRRVRDMAGDELAVAAGIKLKYDVLDGRFDDGFDSADAAELAGKKIIKEFGNEKRDDAVLVFVNKGRMRGTDYNTIQRLIDEGTGNSGKFIGGSRFGEAAVDQGDGRMGRGGKGSDRETGGTPGTVQHWYSPKDYRGPVAHDGVIRQVIEYQNAAKAHREAVADHNENPSIETLSALTDADKAVRHTEQVLHDETRPTLQRVVDEHLAAAARAGNYRANAPPMGGRGDLAPPGMGPTAPPSPEKQIATPHPDDSDGYDSDSTASHSGDSLFDHSDDSASSHSWTDDELSESDLAENDGGPALSDQHTKPGPDIPVGKHDADPQREALGPDEQHSDSSRPENDRGPALSGQGPKSGPDSPVGQRDVDPQRRTPSLDEQRSDSGLSENDGGPVLSEQPAESRPDVPVGQHDGDPQLRTPGADKQSGPDSPVGQRDAGPQLRTPGLDEQRSDSGLSENDRGPAVSEQHGTSHPDSLGDHHQIGPLRETTGTDETPVAEIPGQVHAPGAQDRASQDHTDPDPRRGPKADEPMGRREQQLRNRLRDNDEVRDHPRVIDARDRLTAARTEVEDTRRMVEGDYAQELGSNSAAALREMHDDAQSQLQEAHAAHEAAVEHAVQERYEELRAESEARIAAAEQDALWMRESTEAQMHTAREHLHMTTSHLKKARAEYETAKAELGTGMRDIETSQQKVETARNALHDSRNEYEQARTGNEPRPEYLKQLSREVKQRTRNLRDELIEHEALLTATGSNPEERAAVQRERRELAPAWRIQEAFGTKVEQRAAVWRNALSRQQSDPAAQARVEELRQGLQEQEAAYPQAVENFKTTMLGVIEDRLASVENAKKPDRDAYEAGLADKRAAMQAASRKALAAADAVQKAAFVFRDEVLRKTTDTDPVTGRRATDAEVDRLVRDGSRAERVAAMPEWMTRRDPDSRTPRETQMLAYVLTEFGPADMKGGEGKTLLMIMAGYRDARVHGVVNSPTSSDPLVVDMMNEVRTYLGSHHPDAGVDLVHLQESEPFPQWAWDARDSGRSLLVVGTKEAVTFAGLHEAHAMVEEIERAGAPADVVAGLRDWLRTEPHVDELADHLDAVAREHGSSRRFRPLPEGVGNFDEVDTAFDGQVRGVLSPGAREDANPEQVAELKDAYEKFRIAMLDHRLKPEDRLNAKDFGRPENTKGLWHARLSATAVDKLAAATGGDRTAVLAAAKHYTNFALARWGLKRGADFITSREHDMVMLIHAKTTDKLSWDREKASETRLQELGQYLDVVEGVTVRGDHPADSLTMSLNQWIGSRYLKNPKGVSGTAKEVEDVMYDSWGGARDERGDYFGVPEIERYYRSKLEEEDTSKFTSRMAKLAGIATDVIDAAKISFTVQDGVIVGIEQKGRPQWNISLDNSEIRGDIERLVERVVDKPGGGRMVEETRIELNHWRDKELSERGVIDWVDAMVDRRVMTHALEHGLTIAKGVKLTYTAIDAEWHKQHGGGDAAEIKAAELVKQFGKPGSIMFINKSGARGTDPKPTAESKLLGGVITRVSGGPGFSIRVLLQAIWRSARGGSGEDREDGGTPGSAKVYIAIDDFVTEIEDAQAVREVIQYAKAMEERDQAADRYEADPSAEKQKALGKADERVDETERVLQDETMPRLQRRAEEQLLAPHRVHKDAKPAPGERHPLPADGPGAHRANAPPATSSASKTDAAPGSSRRLAAPSPEGEKVGARLDGSSPDTAQGSRPNASVFDGSSNTLPPKQSGAPGRTDPVFEPPAGETSFGPVPDKIFAADSHSAAHHHRTDPYAGETYPDDIGRDLQPPYVRGSDSARGSSSRDGELGPSAPPVSGSGSVGGSGFEGVLGGGDWMVDLPSQWVVADGPIQYFDDVAQFLADFGAELATAEALGGEFWNYSGAHIYLGDDEGTLRLVVGENGDVYPEYRFSDSGTVAGMEPVSRGGALNFIRGYIAELGRDITAVFVERPVVDVSAAEPAVDAGSRSADTAAVPGSGPFSALTPGMQQVFAYRGKGYSDPRINLVLRLKSKNSVTEYFDRARVILGVENNEAAMEKVADDPDFDRMKSELPPPSDHLLAEERTTLSYVAKGHRSRQIDDILKVPRRTSSRRIDELAKVFEVRESTDDWVAFTSALREKALDCGALTLEELDRTAAPSELMPKDRNLLEHFAAGYSGAEVMAALGLKPDTVPAYLNRIGRCFSVAVSSQRVIPHEVAQLLVKVDPYLRKDQIAELLMRRGGGDGSAVLQPPYVRGSDSARASSSRDGGVRPSAPPVSGSGSVGDWGFEGVLGGGDWMVDLPSQWEPADGPIQYFDDVAQFLADFGAELTTAETLGGEFWNYSGAHIYLGDDEGTLRLVVGENGDVYPEYRFNDADTAAGLEPVSRGGALNFVRGYIAELGRDITAVFVERPVVDVSAAAPAVDTGSGSVDTVADPGSGSFSDLSPEGREAFAYLGKGYSEQRMMRALNKGRASIQERFYWAHLKLGVKNKAEAIKKIEHHPGFIDMVRGVPHPSGHLTAQERDILPYVAKGHRSSQIDEILRLTKSSLNTIKELARVFDVRVSADDWEGYTSTLRERAVEQGVLTVEKLDKIEPPSKLTPHERNVLEYFAAEYTGAEVAAALGFKLDRLLGNLHRIGRRFDVVVNSRRLVPDEVAQLLVKVDPYLREDQIAELRMRRGGGDGSAVLQPPYVRGSDSARASSSRDGGVRPSAPPAAVAAAHSSVADPRASRPSEREADDGEFGPDLRQQHEVELDSPTQVRRQRFNHDGLRPPRLSRGDRRKNLTPAQRERLLPTPAVGMRLRRPTDGEGLLSIIDHHGRVERLPAKGVKVPAILVEQHGHGPDYYQIMWPNEPIQYVRRDLAHVPGYRAAGFTFEHGPNGDLRGTLSWDVPGGEARFLAYDAEDRPTPTIVSYDDRLVVKPGLGPWRWMKFAEDSLWVRTAAPHDIIPELPRLAPRHNDPLFGRDERGKPRPTPHDVRQGKAGDCSLLADLKWLAHHDPDSIVRMLHDNKDGTVSVRLLVEDDHGDTRLEWVRVEKSNYVEVGTETGYFIRHEPGEPLWATMIEKAYAIRFGNGDGYLALEGHPLVQAAARLGKGFHLAKGGALPQPVQQVRRRDILHPLRFDVDTLHELVSTYISRQVRSDISTDDFPVADFEFSHALAETFEDWSAADLRSPTGFRERLDRLHPQQWELEKDALTQYLHEVYDGQPEDRLLSGRSVVAARAIGQLIRWALQRDTTVTLATDRFGGGGSNLQVGPGLLPDHAFTVLGVEYDASGAPVRLLLEDPHDHHHRYAVPAAGIELRLDPRPVEHTGDSVRIRKDPDGTEYFTRPSGKFRRDPDGTVYGLLSDHARFCRTTDGTQHRTYPDGSRFRRTLDGTVFWTSGDGRDKRFKRRGDADWTDDPGRIDPPDATIPRRGGILAVGLEYLPLFSGIGLSGPGAYGLDRPQRVDQLLNALDSNAWRTLFDEQAPSRLDGLEDDLLRGLFDEPREPRADMDTVAALTGLTPRLPAPGPSGTRETRPRTDDERRVGPEHSESGAGGLVRPGDGPGRLLLGAVSEGDRFDEFGWGVFRDKFTRVDFPVDTRFTFTDRDGARYVARVEEPQGPEGGRYVRFDEGRVWPVAEFGRRLRAGSRQLSGGVVRVVQPAVTAGVARVWETGRFLFVLADDVFVAGTKASWREVVPGGEERKVSVTLREGGVLDVAEGDSRLPTVLPVAGLMERLRNVGAVEVEAVQRRLPPPRRGAPTPRQLQVLNGVAQGKTLPKIAEDLGITHSWTEEIWRDVLDRLDLTGGERRDWSIAVLLGREHGWLRPDPLPGDLDFVYFGRDPESGRPVSFSADEVGLLSVVARHKFTARGRNRSDIAEEFGATKWVVDGLVRSIYIKLNLSDEARNLPNARRVAREWGLLARKPEPGDGDYSGTLPPAEGATLSAPAQASSSRDSGVVRPGVPRASGAGSAGDRNAPVADPSGPGDGAVSVRDDLHPGHD
ncbi:WXG100-like domain-containing protein, partial [Nocardia sp. NPDC004278]